MTDTPSPERDAAGRFVRRAGETPKADDDSDTIHPVARMLFGWVSHKFTGAAIFWGLAFLSVALVAAELLIERHEKVALAKATGFYALWGFGAFAFVVLMGWPLGALLRRRENYYEDGEGMPADVDPALQGKAPGRRPHGGGA